MSDGLLIRVLDESLVRCDHDLILIPAQRGVTPGPNWTAVNESLDGLLEEMRQSGEFRAEANQVAIVPTMGRLPARRVALVGLGRPEECSTHVCRLAAASAARAAGKRGLFRAAAAVSDWPGEPAEIASALAEGAELSRFVPDPYRTGERHDSRLRELCLCGAPEQAAREGGIRGRGKNLARELVNEPGNLLDPEELARRAAAMAAAVGLECEVLDEDAMRRLSMGAILAVTQAAQAPARLIVLRHQPARGGPLLALVGKAVTFDSGGISIKPAAGMERMKGDMAGGAAVIGAMQAIAELGVPLNVVGLVPAVVNLPGGRAWMPGDVITAMSGKTIETLSTDAEGRMLLADAVHYARTLEATHIVDIATLTGACVTALGHVASGLYGTDESLVTAVRECGEQAGERHWPMPLFPEYRDQIRSEIADLKNSGGRPAGSVTAAWFIREFAADTPWAHLDIAGTSTLERGRPWAPAGPSGTGVGTFVNLALRLAAGGN